MGIPYLHELGFNTVVAKPAGLVINVIGFGYRSLVMCIPLIGDSVRVGKDIIKLLGFPIVIAH